MYRGDAIEARVISFGIGGGVSFIIGPLLALAFGDFWVIWFLALAYLIAVAVVAFFWPPLGWRTGLWFFAFFPPTYLFILFMTLDAVPFNWRRELISMLGYSPSFIGACLGGWIGSTLRRRSTTNHAPNQPPLVTSPTR